MKLEKFNLSKLTNDEIKILTTFYDKYGVPYSISDDGVLTTYAAVPPEEIGGTNSEIYEDVGYIMQGVFEDCLPTLSKYCDNDNSFTRESIVMMVVDVYNRVSCSQSKLLRGLDNQSDGQISELTKKLSEKEKELSEKSSLVDKLIKENDKLTKTLVEAVASTNPAFFKPPFDSIVLTDGPNPKLSTALTSDRINIANIECLLK